MSSPPGFDRRRIVMRSGQWAVCGTRAPCAEVVEDLWREAYKCTERGGSNNCNYSGRFPNLLLQWDCVHKVLTVDGTVAMTISIASQSEPTFVALRLRRPFLLSAARLVAQPRRQLWQDGEFDILFAAKNLSAAKSALQRGKAEKNEMSVYASPKQLRRAQQICNDVDAVRATA